MFGVTEIVTFDLETRRSRVTAVPVRGDLLGQTANGTGSLLAYLVIGSCKPDDPTMQAELVAPGQPRHVCLVKLP